MRLTPLAIAIGLLVACKAPVPAPPGPAIVVDSLFRIRAPIQSAGAPTPEELAKMAPYLSAELRTLLNDAYALREQDRVDHPDEKPAFADGDLFTSLFEGPSSFVVGADSVTGEQHRIPVIFTYEGGNPAVVWTDHVLLRSEQGRFVVSDIQYGGTWDFATKGTLLTSLRAALSEEQK